MPENPAALVYGRVFLGFIFNILLFGILITQYYIYLTTYKKDPLWMKIFVWVLMILDVVNSAVNSYFIYDGVIIHFGDFEYLAISNWCINADTVITALIAIMVQLFFSWRIHVLIRSRILTSVIVSISLAGLAMALVTNWAVIQTPHYVDFPQWQRTHKTGFKNSDVIVDRIIRITVQTGLLTSIVAILDIITYLTEPDGTHLMLNTPLCKLYANSILSSLNARKGWKLDSAGGNSSHLAETTSHLHSIRPENNPTNLASNKIPRSTPQPLVSTSLMQSPPGVYVQVESHEMRDNILNRTSLTTKDRESAGDFSSVEDGSVDNGYPFKRS